MGGENFPEASVMPAQIGVVSKSIVTVSFRPNPPPLSSTLAVGGATLFESQMCDGSTARATPREEEYRPSPLAKTSRRRNRPRRERVKKRIKNTSIRKYSTPVH